MATVTKTDNNNKNEVAGDVEEAAPNAVVDGEDPVLVAADPVLAAAPAVDDIGHEACAASKAVKSVAESVSPDSKLKRQAVKAP